MNLRLAIVIFAALAAATPALAWAQPSKAAAEKADKLFREGRDAMKRRDHQLACQKFAESQELDPAPGTLINISECEEALGRASLAYRHIREALPGLPDVDPRVPLAKGRLEALERRIARVKVSLGGDATEPGVKVMVDGLEVSQRELREGLVLDPGQHVVLARAVDGREVKAEVDAMAGRSGEVELLIPPAEAKPQGARPRERPKQPKPVDDDAGSSQRAIGYIVAGAGVVGLGLGTYFGLAWKGTNDRAKDICPSGLNCSADDVARHEQLRGEASDQKIGALVSLGIGAVGLGTGLVLVLSAPSSKDATSRISFSPTVSHQGGGLQGALTW